MHHKYQRVQHKVVRYCDESFKITPLTSSILVAKVWEPPHVAEAHAEPHLCQHILDLGVPCRSVGNARLDSIATVPGCKPSYRLTLTQPGSVLVTVQWRFFRLEMNKDGEWKT